MFLARTLQQLLIKVNLSGFRAVHMDQGCSHLLVEYPSWERLFLFTLVLAGILSVQCTL